MTNSDPSELPVLDDDTIDGLRELMEEEFDDLVETYLRDLPHQIHSLQEAMAQQNAESLWRVAHSLKAASGSIGALRLSELCRQIEIAGREEALDVAQRIVEQVIQTASMTQGALQATLQSQ